MKVNTSLVRSIIESNIEDLYNAMHLTTPKKRRYSDGYVFDEDKSVKWNKEQVKIKNAEYEAERERLIKEQDNIVQKICDNMANDILDEYNDYDLGLTLPEIQLAINHAIDNNFDMDEIEDYIIRHLQILVDYKALNINTCKEVYVVRSAENDFKSQILGVFSDQYAAWDCERWYHSIGVGSIRIDEESLQDKFEES